MASEQLYICANTDLLVAKTTFSFLTQQTVYLFEYNFACFPVFSFMDIHNNIFWKSNKKTHFSLGAEMTFSWRQNSTKSGSNNWDILEISMYAYETKLDCESLVLYRLIYDHPTSWALIVGQTWTANCDQVAIISANLLFPQFVLSRSWHCRYCESF